MAALPPAVFEDLCGLDLILHAGDVDDPALLDALGQIVPVRAARGNWCLRVGSERLARAFPGFGHTQRALIERRDDALYINPGPVGASPRQTPSLGRMWVTKASIDTEIIPS